jgi:L-seryl-tRNA(Ser) seleniumtransferase
MSGARLHEVGTTNKTHARDYEQAIGDDTALLLKVHRSNFAVVGFTAEVELDELVAIGRRRNLRTMIDLGSGCLLEAHELTELGLPAEPSVRAAVAAGADLVTFSGDKLLGGPQAGILAGSRAAIAVCKAHPLMRALRPDKLTIAAIEATLAIYRDGRARRDIPTIAMLAATAAVLRTRADDLAGRIGPLAGGLRAEVVDCESAVGGGALPTAVLPSRAVALTSDRLGADAIDARLRAHDPPVVARIHEDRVLVDVRTVADAELAAVAAAIRALA